jgi:hypothetical protein
MVDQSKTYAAVVANKGTPHKKHQMVAKKPVNSITSQTATIRGVLTTAIDKQRVILAKVTLPEVKTEQRKKLIATLEPNKLREAMYKAFGVNYTETQGPPKPPTAAEIAEQTKTLTKSMLTMKQPEGPFKVKSVIMCGHNHNYSPSNLSRSVFLKKPTIGRKTTGHYVVPPTSELKRSRECFHCQLKGHYARQCRTKKKELKQKSITTTIRTTVTDTNRYKALEEESLDGPTGGPTYVPSHLIHTNSLRRPALRNGLDQASPTSHLSQGSKLLGATEIKELIQANVTRYSQKERTELATKLRDQLKQPPRTSPVTISDPTAVINKVNLMAMEHDARLEILDQLVPKSMWGTPKHMALLTEMGIDSVLVSKRNSIYVPFKLHHFRGTSEETALLDTGATESFINTSTVKRLKLGAQELEMSRPVYNVDRTPNHQGTITQVCYLLVLQGNKKQRTPFYVTNLGTDRFILGYPWCQDFKPDIDWSNSRLNGPKIRMETLLYGKIEHLHHHLKEELKAKEDNDLIFTVSAADTPENPEDALVALEESCQPDDSNDNTLWSGVTASEMECGWVEFIRRTHNAVEMAHEYAKNHEKKKITLPERFKRHAALFSDEEAKKFPPS